MLARTAVTAVRAVVQEWKTKNHASVKPVIQYSPAIRQSCSSHMKLLDVPLGLAINSHDGKLVDGISRLTPAGCKQDLNRRERR